MKKLERRDPSKTVSYSRVSTEEQAESGNSLKFQLETTRAYGATKGLSVVKEYIEAGASGREEQRKVFQSMLADLTKPGCDISTIIVTHTSRFMRNADAARFVKARLKKHGVSLVAIQQPLTDDPSGWFVGGMFELIDQLESDMNGSRTSAAMRQNAQRGFFNGSAAPFGFRVDQSGISGAPKKQLVPHLDEVEVVREIFRLYVAGKGAKAVASELNERGLRFRGRAWTRDKIFRVVSEPAAVGRYFWGKRDSRAQVIRDEEEWVLIAVEPIVETALFELAQTVRNERLPERNPGRTASSPLLLAGLVRCARCGGVAQLESSGKTTADGRASYRYYNCRGFLRVGKGACKGVRVKTQTLERAVLEHVANQMFSEEHCREILRDIVEDEGVLRRKSEELKRALRTAIVETDSRLQAWYDKIEKGSDPDNIGLERVKELRAKRDDLGRELATLPAIQTVPPCLYKAECIQRFQQKLKLALLSDQQHVARAYLKRLIDRVIVGPDEILIEAKSEAVVALMSAGSERMELKNGPDTFLTTVLDWHARRDSNP